MLRLSSQRWPNGTLKRFWSTEDAGISAVFLSYVLRATFDAADQGFADAQVLDSEAEGVPDGQLTVVELDGSLEILNGELKFTAQATPAWTDLGVYSQAITRELGRALIFKITETSTEKAFIFGLDDATGLTDPNAHHEYIFQPFSGSGIAEVRTRNTTERTRVHISRANGTSFLAIVLGGYNVSGEPYRAGEVKADYAYGACALGKGAVFGGGADWLLLNRTKLSNTSPLYALFANFDAAGTGDDMRMADSDLSGMIVPTDFDLAPAAGATFTHDADFYMEFEVDALPSSGQIEVEFRQQTANNDTWRVTIDSAGNIDLDEIVSGTPTQRGTGSGVSAASRIMVIGQGTRIRVHRSDTNSILIDYTSATNFQAETAGEVESLGTGGAIDDLATYPRSGYADLDDV